MATRFSTEKAAQAWCTPKTEKTTMDPDLAEAFADILDEIWGKPWLGNATTAELLDEIRARCEVNGTLYYKTVGGPTEPEIRKAFVEGVTRHMR